MTESKRTFVAGKMNQDVDERLLPDGQYRSAKNITIESTGGSNMGAIQNARGNTLMFSPTAFLLSRGITITNPKTIGAVVYEPLNLIYWFITSDIFDGIFEFNQRTEITTLVIGSTTNQLNFDSTSLITGVNYLFSDDGSFLFWTDNINPPRKINITRAKSYSINDSRINIDIDVVLRPPLNSPALELKNNNDAVESNNIEEKFLYFSYRYKYIDNEFSSMSPFSSVGFNAKPLSFDPVTGDNIGMLNDNNIVRITFQTGNEFVKEIQILARDTRSLNVMVVETLNKNDENIANNSVSFFDFRNNKIYATLPSDQVTRIFDNVPLKAQAQDIIGNRLIYGNYTQFRDIPKINYIVGFNSNLTNNPTIINPRKTFRSDRDYEVGIVYGDEYGRITTVLTSKGSNISNSSSNSVYIPPINSSKVNYLQTTIKNLPPSWATNYRMYIKQSKKDYYNLFPISIQVSGDFRYIQISEADRDKISVGEYIIFKTANAQPTHSNRKFKVLEFELKATNAINTNSPAGLYLKIKPDPISAGSFLAVPVNTITSSPLFITNNSGTGNITSAVQIPYCFPSYTSNVHCDTVFYRSGSNLYTPSQNAAATVKLTKNAASTTTNNDVRLKVRIVTDPSITNSSAPTHYITNIDIDNQNAWSSPLPILNTPINISTLVPSSGTIFLNFGVGNYQVGDVYVFNVRGYLLPIGNSRIRSPRNGDGLQGASFNSYVVPAPMPAPSPNSVPSPPWPLNMGYYNGMVSVGFTGKIYAGAIIKITVQEGVGCSPNIVDTFTTTLPIASREYPSFEEFFWEECSGVTIDVVNSTGTSPNKNRYSFRYVGSLTAIAGGPSGKYTWINNPNIPQNGVSSEKSAIFFPALMKQGCNGISKYTASATLEQAATPTYIVETVPLDVETPIFHETMRTYPIVNGLHKVGWQYSSNTTLGLLGLNFEIQLNSSYPHYFELNQPINIGDNVGVVYSIIDGKTITVEMPSTLPVGSGSVLMVGEIDQSSTSDANVILNNDTVNSEYNAFCYGNGLESYRIRDSFNNSTMKYSIRASTVIDDYEQEDKFASVIYSGIFRGDSSINRLNEFNLSLANFKNLDKEYGSIQKLYSRDSDLLVLHQDKITSVLFGKNLLVDAIGGGQVASIPEVLGNQVPYPLDNGISNDPSSFAVNSGNLYFTDAKRGVVLEMINGQNVIEISSNGMKNLFRDLLTTNINKQKIGAYDPYHKMYTLTTNDTRNSFCLLTISKASRSFDNSGNLVNLSLFNINTLEEWTITLIDTGYGTNWISLNAISGTGSAVITGNPSPLTAGTPIPRNMTIRVNYCNTYIDFTLTETQFRPVVESNIAILIKPI
jgi:hypothetical protein